MKQFRNYFPGVFVLCFLSSCGDLSQEAERRFNEIKSKTESLDSLIIRETDKVLALDSLINFESEKVKKLDSLINESTTKLDSITKGKFELIEKLVN